MAKQICPTPGFEKLLVATDGSEFSKAAVQEAIKIASACSSTLYVLLVIEINAEVEIWDAKSADKLEKDMRKYLDGIKAKAAKEGINCEVSCTWGMSRTRISSTRRKNARSAPSSWAATAAPGSPGS